MRFRAWPPRPSNEAGLTGSQLAANQTQIDDAIASIDRIIRTTGFNGQKLLDGSLGINVSGGTGLSDIHVYSRNPSTDAAGHTINVAVATAAEQAHTTGAGEALATNSASEATTISISGSLGTQVIEVSADENLSSITAKINDVKALTGVEASQTGAAAAIHVKTTGFGSDEFVKISVLDGGTQNGSGSFNSVNESGVDATVSVNGHAAAAQGKEVFYNSNGLSLSFKLSTTTNVDDATATFTVDNTGGATFQLGTDSSTRATLGIDGFYSQSLGTGEAGERLSALKSGGSYDMVSDPAKAVEIVTAAKNQVARLQGRIGGFQKYQVQTSLNAMNVTKESLDVGQEHHRRRGLRRGNGRVEPAKTS